jgi:alanine-glyoxylate transaminase/serine-glyoxylate transaminase/serine-pyruvate transaminase
LFTIHFFLYPGGVPIAPEKPLGTAFTIEEIGELIKKHKPKVVYIVNGESSTGVFQKVEGLGDLCVE